MFVLGENRIVGLEIILFQDRLAVSDLQIEKRVTQTENPVRHDGLEEGQRVETQRRRRRGVCGIKVAVGRDTSLCRVLLTGFHALTRNKGPRPSPTNKVY